MIEEERLKELIKQGATIWGVDNEIIDKIHLGWNYYRKVDNGLIRFDRYYIGPNSFYDKDIAKFNNIDLYENEEDANFYVNYQNVKRLQVLALPTLETVRRELKEKGSCVFYDFDRILGIVTGNKRILIKDYNNYCGENIEKFDVFNKSFNKKNYLEACQVAKKLFWGEEV